MINTINLSIRERFRILIMNPGRASSIFNKKIASNIRIDKGTETGKMATLHAYLRSNHDVNLSDTVIYGKSTSNQVHYVHVVEKAILIQC